MSSTITPQILLRAYAAGIFPMAENAEDAALYWVEPEERGIIPLNGLHISHSLRRTVRRRQFEVRIDADFPAVIAACAERAPDRSSTWINGRIRNLYTQLHRMGACHSVECWQEGKLAGGLYGVRIGAVFFGESMFSRVADASKVALVHLVARLNAGGFRLLDAQFVNAHLARFGAVSLPKEEYHQMLEPALDANADFFVFKSDALPDQVLKLAAGNALSTSEYSQKSK
jgi:leucyl/phenylalanyl-tRNA--protein transferase